jgi:hypothetical protein
MVGRGEKFDENGKLKSIRIAHFGRAAEIDRLRLMINVTGEFINKYSSHE